MAKTRVTQATMSTRLTFGDIDLSRGFVRRVDNGHARAVTELNRLLGERESARDKGLRCDHGGDRSEYDEGIHQPTRDQGVEGVGDGVRPALLLGSSQRVRSMAPWPQ